MRILKVGGALVLAGAGAYGVMAVVQWVLATPTVQVALALIAAFVTLALAFAAGQWWTARTMQAGAQIALQAQNVNDAWDARKTAAFATLARAMLSLGQQAGSTTPALPMPQQAGGEWLPQLSEFTRGNEPDPEVWGNVLESGNERS